MTIETVSVPSIIPVPPSLVVASFVCEEDAAREWGDGWEMLRWGWECARCVGTEYETDGDVARAENAFDLYFGRVPAWGWC